jgi:hypothetical protein
MKAQLWFYKAPGKFFDKVIRWWTKSRYSHVEVVVGGIAYSADAWSGEVRSTLVSTFNKDNWDIVEVELDKTTEWLRNQIGEGYDWLGIFGFAWFGVQNENRWYCSELAAAALGIDTRPISPGELYEEVTIWKALCY